MRKALLIALLLCPFEVLGQTGALQGTSTLGGISATTQGSQSSNKLQGVIPAAKISIYLTNTITLATLTTDGTHSLANPFYSNASNASNPGGFIAFAAVNQGYDIVASSGQGVPNCTTGPLCYTAPVTLCKDCFPSAQFISPGIITIVGWNGPVTCVAGSCDITGQSTVFQHNGTNLATQSKLNFLDAPPSLPGGSTPVTWSADGAGGFGGYVPTVTVANGLAMDTIPPTAGTYITVYPNGFSSSQGGLGSATGTNASAYVTKPACGLGGCSGSTVNQVTWTFALPAYVHPGNVTAIYAQSSASTTYLGGSGFNATGQLSCAIGVNTYTLFTTNSLSFPMQVWTHNIAAATGSTVSSITCQAEVSATDPIQTGQTVNVASIYLQLADSVDTAPASTAVNVVPPLFYNPAINTLGIDPQATFLGAGTKVYTVAQILAIASPVQYSLYPVRDGSNSTDCATGGGSTHLNCFWNGTTWAAF